MNTRSGQGGPPALNRWVRATTLGWLLGLVLTVVLAIAWDQIGGGAQFMVGIGMGAGVGFAQARVLGEWGQPAGRWFWATTVGMGLPFVMWDLGSLAAIEAFFSLPLSVFAGSLLVGTLQSILLRRRFTRPSWWVPASVVGWCVPTAGIALGDTGFLSGAGGVLSVGAMFLGGAILGVVTGWTLLRMPPRSAV